MDALFDQILDVNNNKVRYDKLVEDRKECSECRKLGLTNASVIEGGCFDCNEIGGWSQWHHSLKAKLMVVGQDFTDVEGFRTCEGRPDPTYPTNQFLQCLLGHAGFNIQNCSVSGNGILFFTNAVLCMKEKEIRGAQAPVNDQCFKNCGRLFLRPLIEIVQPEVVVCLGAKAYRGLLTAYNPDYKLKRQKFLTAVEAPEPEKLPGGLLVFAVYHCGKGSQNRNRSRTQQMKDWKRIGEFCRGRTAAVESS